MSAGSAEVSHWVKSPPCWATARVLWVRWTVV